jgi:hypothetical protein
MLKFIRTYIKRIIFGERIKGGEKVDYKVIPTYTTYKVKRKMSLKSWMKKYNVGKVPKNY